MPVPRHFEDIHAQIEASFLADEESCVEKLLQLPLMDESARARANKRARQWVESIRRDPTSIDEPGDLFGQFGLTTDEGDALLDLAESLLRIPDSDTADALIKDKLTDTHWEKALLQEGNLPLRMTGRALSWSGKLVTLDDSEKHNPVALAGKLVSRLGQPVIREAVRSAISWIAGRFILDETLAEALKEREKEIARGRVFCFDLLEGPSKTSAAAAAYNKRCLDALERISDLRREKGLKEISGITIKLSALHPRFEYAQSDRVLTELMPKLVSLAETAARYDIPLMINAEDSDRLFLVLNVIEKLLDTATLGGWEGLGITVQAYEKRVLPVIDLFAALATHNNRRIKIRLIKGNAWEKEIKKAQGRGWKDFPVYTRKASTDLSYLAASKRLFDHRACLEPIFATHNAITIASVLEMAPKDATFSFQRLLGQGDDMYDILESQGWPTSVYAPVGDQAKRLDYVARRLMEHGADTYFLNKLYDDDVSINDLIEDPFDILAHLTTYRHPLIRKPADLLAPERLFAEGLDLSNPSVATALLEKMHDYADESYSAVPLISGKKYGPADHVVQTHSPIDGGVIGEVLTARDTHIDEAFDDAINGQKEWAHKTIDERAVCLEKLASLLEEHRCEVMELLIREAGKTIPDALAEHREAIDYCRYYAHRARQDFAPRPLPAPAGEENILHFAPRGVFVSITPSNFPLAIFVGQATAALVAGNAVIAKPSLETTLVASFVAPLFHEAGVMESVFHLLPGGADVGEALVRHPSCDGVVFTGASHTSRLIHRAMAEREGAIIPFIAQASGQNAMIVDTSVMPEQAADDAIISAFKSSGQRCASLRLLCLPLETADEIISLIKGQMQEIRLGDPFDLSTDVGPVIDEKTRDDLLRHQHKMEKTAHLLAKIDVPPSHENGFYFAPQAWEIPDISLLKEEIFGPFLHIYRYDSDDFAQMIDQINALGYGLTAGIQSRIETTVNHVRDHLKVGNIYANRSMIGAVVGLQPFGGIGLSGVGPKSGGLFYLYSFAYEKVTTTNKVSGGGNPDLLELE